MQCSSIGSLGPNEFVWFKGQFGQALASTNKMASGSVPAINMVYPSKQNVMGSYDGKLSELNIFPWSSYY